MPEPLSVDAISDTLRGIVVFAEHLERHLERGELAQVAMELVDLGFACGDLASQVARRHIIDSRSN